VPPPQGWFCEAAARAGQSSPRRHPPGGQAGTTLESRICRPGRRTEYLHPTGHRAGRPKRRTGEGGLGSHRGGAGSRQPAWLVHMGRVMPPCRAPAHPRSEPAVEETALHEASKQPDAEPNEARDDDEDDGGDARGVDDARTLRRGAMRVRSELRLSGHPGPATESQCIRNDLPSWDSAATSSLSSHDDSIGARAHTVKGTAAVGDSVFRSSMSQVRHRGLVRT
jgi:hypothetical protein